MQRFIFVIYKKFLPYTLNIMIKNIILIASGKGGVGKSTVSINLAVALSKIGKNKVGLLDGDIYGPSIPKMLDLKNKPTMSKNKKISPYEKFGIKCISIGNMIPKDNAIIWRGAMASRALRQLFEDVDWGELDYLIVDLPPGTGDIQLSLCQNFSVDGSVIVSTPQEIALIDARKAINMFKKVNVPILGFVQNMSYFEQNNKKNYIFGKNGVANEAKIQKIRLLGEIPILPKIVESCEVGVPIITKEKKISEIFEHISRNLQSELEASTKKSVRIET